MVHKLIELRYCVGGRKSLLRLFTSDIYVNIPLIASDRNEIAFGPMGSLHSSSTNRTIIHRDLRNVQGLVRLATNYGFVWMSARPFIIDGGENALFIAIEKTINASVLFFPRHCVLWIRVRSSFPNKVITTQLNTRLTANISDKYCCIRSDARKTPHFPRDWGKGSINISCIKNMWFSIFFSRFTISKTRLIF